MDFLQKSKLNKLGSPFLKAAFTLAEILIVLGIIGIIAELTIPTVLANTKKQEIVVRVKKAYSIFSQATLLINSDCTGNLTNCITSPTTTTQDDATSREQITSLYKGKMRIAKDCTDGTTTGCFADTSYKNLDNTPYGDIETLAWFDKSRFALSDGMSVAFDWDGTITSSLFNIFVDINGPKAPNQKGKDLFIFYYDANKKVLLPHTANNCSTSGNGYGCSGKVLQEGEITYY